MHCSYPLVSDSCQNPAGLIQSYFVQIWEGFEQRLLFDGRVRVTDQYSAEGHLREMVHQLGPAPAELIRRSKFGSRYFNNAGTENPNIPPVCILCVFWPSLADIGTVLKLPSLDAPKFRLHEENLEGAQQNEFIDFMKFMLKWLPEELPSAGELLQHPWLDNDDL